MNCVDHNYMSSNPNNPRNTLNKCPICDWCESVGFNRHLDDKIEDGDTSHRNLKESIIALYDDLGGPQAAADQLGIDKRFVRFVIKSENRGHKKEVINQCPLCSWQGPIGFNRHLEDMVNIKDHDHINLKQMIISLGNQGIEPEFIGSDVGLSRKLIITILVHNNARKWSEFNHNNTEKP